MMLRPCRPAGFAALAAIVAIALGACGRSGDGPSTATVPHPAAPPTGPSEPPLRGVIGSAGTTFSFRACGAPESALATVTEGRDEVGAVWAALHPAPGRAVYVEIRGKESADGKSVSVEDVLRAHVDGEGSGCDRPVFDGDFFASGNEPGWSVEIRPSGILYRSAAEPKGLSFPYSALRTGSGTIEYAARIDKPKVRTLAVEIEPGRCVDSMSGEIRGFVARVEFDGVKLQGCAAAGVPAGGFGDGPLDELRRYDGVNPAGSSFWSIEPWKGRLMTLLRSSRGSFDASMQACGPVMEDRGVNYVIGNKPHRRGADIAVFAADPGTDTINVVLVENGMRRDFKEGDRNVALPSEVRTALANLEAR
jgi:uncharacterized membrane protein